MIACNTSAAQSVILSASHEDDENAVGFTSQSTSLIQFNNTGPLNISAAVTIWATALASIFQIVAPPDQVGSSFPPGITSNSAKSQISVLLPSVTSNNLSSLRIFYNGACLSDTAYHFSQCNSTINTPAGDSWTLYLGYSPVGSFTENLIPISFLPTGEMDKSTSNQSLDTANALLAPTINAMRLMSGDPKFDFWKFMNWIVVSYFWLFLYDFGQTNLTYYNHFGDESLSQAFSAPVFYSSTNNIFVNSTLFSIYSSYLTDILSLVPGFLPPEFLPVDSNSSLQPTATVFLRSYSCMQRQLQPWTNAVISVLVADYVFITGGYHLVLTVATWWQKRRNAEGKSTTDPSKLIANMCEGCMLLKNNIPLDTLPKDNVRNGLNSQSPLILKTWIMSGGLDWHTITDSSTFIVTLISWLFYKCVPKFDSWISTCFLYLFSFTPTFSFSAYTPYENQTCGWFPRSGGGFSLTKCEDFPPAKIPPNFGGKMKQKVPPFLRGFWNGDCWSNQVWVNTEQSQLCITKLNTTPGYKVCPGANFLSWIH